MSLKNRQGLFALVEEQNETCYVDANGIPKHCSTIVSSFNEVLRYHDVQVSTRKVVEDHTPGDKVLLKQGNALTIPATVQHSDTRNWGPDAGEFDLKRFMRPAGHDGSKKGAQRATFRGLGGGHHLCPGRHFATAEMIAVAALFILRFAITPVLGTWN